MPRLPVDGKRVIEHRITLGGFERNLMQDIATSYRIDSFSGNDSIIEVLSDGSKVIAALGTLGALLELFGITDVFDFDDDLLASVGGIKEKIKERAKADPLGTWADLLKVTAIQFPVRVGEYVAEEVKEVIEAQEQR